MTIINRYFYIIYIFKKERLNLCYFLFKMTQYIYIQVTNHCSTRQLKSHSKDGKCPPFYGYNAADSKKAVINSFYVYYSFKYGFTPAAIENPVQNTALVPFYGYNIDEFK